MKNREEPGRTGKKGLTAPHNLVGSHAGKKTRAGEAQNNRGINMKKAKTIAEIQADPRVDSLHKEESGWWLYLRSGWTCPAMECGTIHESTIKECAELLHTATRDELFGAVGLVLVDRIAVGATYTGSEILHVETVDADTKIAVFDHENGDHDGRGLGVGRVTRTGVEWISAEIPTQRGANTDRAWSQGVERAITTARKRAEAERANLKATVDEVTINGSTVEEFGAPAPSLDVWGPNAARKTRPPALPSGEVDYYLARALELLGFLNDTTRNGKARRRVPAFWEFSLQKHGVIFRVIADAAGNPIWELEIWELMDGRHDDVALLADDDRPIARDVGQCTGTTTEELVDHVAVAVARALDMEWAWSQEPEAAEAALDRSFVKMHKLPAENEVALLIQERAEADAKAAKLAGEVEGLRQELQRAYEGRQEADRNAEWWNAEALTLKAELEALAKHHAKDQEVGK